MVQEHRKFGDLSLHIREFAGTKYYQGTRFYLEKDKLLNRINDRFFETTEALYRLEAEFVASGEPAFKTALEYLPQISEDKRLEYVFSLLFFVELFGLISSFNLTPDSIRELKEDLDNKLLAPLGKHLLETTESGQPTYHKLFIQAQCNLAEETNAI